MDTSRRITVAATALAATAVLIAAYALGQSGAHATSATVTPAPSPTSGPSSAAPAISVAGLGKVSGTPDILSLSLGVEVRAANVSAAMDSASKSMRDVLAALKSSGVADADLQTAGVSVQGNYRYDNDGTSHINGYVATQQLTAKLRSVSKAGAVIAAAVAAGGDAIRLNGLSLSLDNDSALLSQARERAFAEARSKAEQYAKLAGVSLGTVISINESVLAGNQPYYGKSAMDFAASAGPASAPIQAGSQDVAVTVAVVYAIG
ncbi:MAG: uncharacterized protein QOC60_1539 [Frankiaceae bacterium]|nr:uncharacterized protein [Frankiaceae bacterium]